MRWMMIGCFFHVHNSFWKIIQSAEILYVGALIIDVFLLNPLLSLFDLADIEWKTHGSKNKQAKQR